MDYLNDWEFLKKLFSYHVQEYWAYFTCLDFTTEKVLATISGKIISGSGNITAKSPVRRTASLNMIFDKQTGKLISEKNLISIDKKISFSIGLTNPFYGNPDYEDYWAYGEIITFKMGVYFITSCNATAAATGGTVTVQLTDKMGKLNGSPGGILPATVAFHERLVFDANGDYSVENPLILEIINECVNHFGGESFNNIIIEDVPKLGRQVVIYNGDTPIWFNINVDNTASFPATSFQISSNKPTGVGWGPNVGVRKTKGEVIGYLETPLTWPGELVKKSGSNVVQVLQDIQSSLGNYEFFYDVEGNFHFRQIQNYDKTGDAPLLIDPFEPNAYNQAVQNGYIPKYSNNVYLTEFATNDMVISPAFSPKYDNIKNDYICWGTRKDDDGNELAVRYHLAIDKIPKDSRIFNSMNGSVIDWGENLCNKWIVAVRRNSPDMDDDNMILRYDFYRDPNNSTRILNPTDNPNWFVMKDGYWTPKPLTAPNVGEKYDPEIYCPALQDYFPGISSAQFDWREELYRSALMNYGNSATGNYAETNSSNYDAELIAEWRDIYDPTNISGNDSFRELWEGYFTDQITGAKPWTGYTPDTIIAPQKLRYWLDIISSDAPIGRYGIDKIGRRTYTNENSKINEVYPEQVIDVVFFEIPSSAKDPDGKLLQKKQQEYMGIGQNFCQLKADQMNMLTAKNSFGTCYEDVRQAFMEHTIFNSGITLQIIPIWYLDVNRVARFANEDLDVNGDYLIDSIGWNLGQGSPTMNITLSEALVII